MIGTGNWLTSLRYITQLSNSGDGKGEDGQQANNTSREDGEGWRGEAIAKNAAENSDRKAEGDGKAGRQSRASKHKASNSNGAGAEAEEAEPRPVEVHGLSKPGSEEAYGRKAAAATQRVWPRRQAAGGEVGWLGGGRAEGRGQRRTGKVYLNRYDLAIGQKRKKKTENSRKRNALTCGRFAL